MDTKRQFDIILYILIFYLLCPHLTMIPPSTELFLFSLIFSHCFFLYLTDIHANVCRVLAIKNMSGHATIMEKYAKALCISQKTSFVNSLTAESITRSCTYNYIPLGTIIYHSLLFCILLLQNVQRQTIRNMKYEKNFFLFRIIK